MGLGGRLSQLTGAAIGAALCLASSAFAVTTDDVVAIGQEETIHFKMVNASLAAAKVSAHTVISYLANIGLEPLEITKDGSVPGFGWFDVLALDLDHPDRMIYLKFGAALQETQYVGKILASNGGFTYSGTLYDYVPYSMTFINYSVPDGIRMIEEISHRVTALGKPHVKNRAFAKNAARALQALDSLVPNAMADDDGSTPLTGMMGWIVNAEISAINNVIGKDLLQFCKSCLLSALKGVLSSVISPIMDVIHLFGDAGQAVKSGTTTAYQAAMTPGTLHQKLSRIASAISDTLKTLKTDFMNLVSGLKNMTPELMGKLYCGLVAQLATPAVVTALTGGTAAAYLATKIVEAVLSVAKDYEWVVQGIEKMKDVAETLNTTIEGNKTLSAVNTAKEKVYAPASTVGDYAGDVANTAAAQ